MNQTENVSHSRNQCVRNNWHTNSWYKAKKYMQQHISENSSPMFGGEGGEGGKNQPCELQYWRGIKPFPLSSLSRLAVWWLSGTTRDGAGIRSREGQMGPDVLSLLSLLPRFHSYGPHFVTGSFNSYLCTSSHRTGCCKALIL